MRPFYIKLTEYETSKNTAINFNLVTMVQPKNENREEQGCYVFIGGEREPVWVREELETICRWIAEAAR